VNELTVEVDAAEVGLDPERLKRLDAHFAGYVADGRLPGWLLTVRRHGRLAHVARCGSRDVEAGLPVTDDTVWRIYSMTKPVTSVAAMLLYEEGAVALTDPVSAFIPSFADVRVFVGGSDLRPVTVPATEPVRVWHLLTHTAGLTYGFHRSHPVDALYRAAGFEWGSPRDVDLAQACDLWAGLPLLFQPGTEWNYSVATDVLGRVVEVASGQRLDEFFADRIFGPLGMTDTAFYVTDPAKKKLIAKPMPKDSDFRVGFVGYADVPMKWESGGGGMLSTMSDFAKFSQMILDGGKFDGKQIISPKSFELMTSDHVGPGSGVQRDFFYFPGDGFGFGLGFGVRTDPGNAKPPPPGSLGELKWDGVSGCYFVADRKQDMFFVLLEQTPSERQRIQKTVKQLIYEAMEN
jgi:CubicO group peptidase (beta-lactamase class C family)